MANNKKQVHVNSYQRTRNGVTEIVSSHLRVTPGSLIRMATMLAPLVIAGLTGVVGYSLLMGLPKAVVGSLLGKVFLGWGVATVAIEVIGRVVDFGLHIVIRGGYVVARKVGQIATVGGIGYVGAALVDGYLGTNILGGIGSLVRFVAALF